MIKNHDEMEKSDVWNYGVGKNAWHERAVHVNRDSWCTVVDSLRTASQQVETPRHQQNLQRRARGTSAPLMTAGTREAPYDDGKQRQPKFGTIVRLVRQDS